MSGFSSCPRTQKEATRTDFLKKELESTNPTCSQSSGTKVRSVLCSESRSAKLPEVWNSGVGPTESLKGGDAGGQQENPIWTEANPKMNGIEAVILGLDAEKVNKTCTVFYPCKFSEETVNHWWWIFVQNTGGSRQERHHKELGTRNTTSEGTIDNSYGKFLFNGKTDTHTEIQEALNNDIRLE